MTTTETPAEALARIQSRVSQNDFAIIHQFYACGISPEDITPRENVLTFKAWKALGRRVAKGASSQRVTVWRPIKKTDKKTGEEKGGMIPTTACLFHITQTIAEDAEKGTRPDAWSNPQLVKAGTYEAIDAETDEHAQELADISHAEYKADEQLQQVYAENTTDIIDAEFTREPLRLTWTPPEPAPATARRIEAPKTGKARQLAMF